MPEDIETIDPEESEEDYIRRILGDEPEEPHAEEVAAAEEKFAEEDPPDKLSKKFDAKLSAFEKKFEKGMLTGALDKFMGSADEIEKGIMREFASDVKSLADFERAERLVKSQAEKLRAKAVEYEAQAQEDARAKAATAWGVTPQDHMAPPPDQEEELMKRIRLGDTKAAFAAIIGNDLPH